MAIDDSGEWWTGSEAADIEPYLAEYTATEEAYPATAFHPVICPCGSDRFRMVRAGSITQRTCSNCGQVRYICRDGDPIHWEEAAEEEEPEPYTCVGCDGDAANVCLGFAGYPEKTQSWTRSNGSMSESGAVRVACSVASTTGR